MFKKIFTKLTRNSASLDELVWATIFSSITSESTWLKNKNFAPGRWAMGYPALYILYRVLNEMQPQSVLELGLGESTRMITQYTNYHENIRHIVVEHDKDWATFYKKQINMSEHSDLVFLEQKIIPFRESSNVRVFSDFSEIFKEQSFDFICIDAPWAGDMTNYARVDVLNLMPKILNKSFVILLDDFDRSGEKHTAQAMEENLKNNGISYAKGVYSGLKKTFMLCSVDNKFFTTL